MIGQEVINKCASCTEFNHRDVEHAHRLGRRRPRRFSIITALPEGSRTCRSCSAQRIQRVANKNTKVLVTVPPSAMVRRASSEIAGGKYITVLPEGLVPGWKPAKHSAKRRLRGWSSRRGDTSVTAPITETLLAFLQIKAGLHHRMKTAIVVHWHIGSYQQRF